MRPTAKIPIGRMLEELGHAADLLYRLGAAEGYCSVRDANWYIEQSVSELPAVEAKRSEGR